MNIEPVEISEEVITLLAECGLPVADLSPSSTHRFFGARVNGELIAVVGLELYPPEGLLRSLAVSAAYRGQGMAQRLVCFAESFAVAQGVAALYLLTTTAAEFFLRLGFAPCPRETAPSSIRATSQFSGLCPASSAFLYKRFAPGC